MLGEAIRQIRKSKSLEQKDLAKRLNTTQATISRWECEKPPPPTKKLPDIATALGVTRARIYRLAADLETSIKPKEEGTRDRGKPAGGCC